MWQTGRRAEGGEVVGEVLGSEEETGDCQVFCWALRRVSLDEEVVLVDGRRRRVDSCFCSLAREASSGRMVVLRESRISVDF